MGRMSEMTKQAGTGLGRRRGRVDMGAGQSQRFGPSGHRAIGPSGHRAIGPSGHRAIGPSGVMSARRPAGARKPASQSARPEPRSGRFRGFPLFHPALALLLGVLSLLAAAPAVAQTIPASWF